VSQSPPSDMVGLVHRPDSFAEGLVSGGALARVAQAIVNVVDDSFLSHPMHGGSKSMSPEWKSRRAFCVATFRELQGDLRWTTDRALSMLRPCLLARLNGMPSPVAGRAERRALYAPDRGLVTQGSLRVDDVAYAPAGPEGGVESLAELKDQLKLDDSGEAT